MNKLSKTIGQGGWWWEWSLRGVVQKGHLRGWAGVFLSDGLSFCPDYRETLAHTPSLLLLSLISRSPRRQTAGRSRTLPFVSLEPRWPLLIAATF